jgi:hypothetical protein
MTAEGSVQEGDPRPVFEGDWNSATGVQKGEHSERVRQWKERNGIAQGAAGRGAARSGANGVVEPSDPLAPSAHSPVAARDADDIAALQAVIDKPKTLASDRIRAIEAKQRILNRIDAEQAEHEHGELLALHAALCAVPEAQRGDALRALVRVEGEGQEGDAEGQSTEAERVAQSAPGGAA